MLPGPQEIARAEQLGRVAPLDPGAPQQHAFEHEQAVAAAGLVGVDRDCQPEAVNSTVAAAVACRACAR